MRHVRLERRRWNEDLLERKGKPSLGLKVQRSHCRDRFVLDLATFVEGGFVLPGKEIGKTRGYHVVMVEGVRKKQVLRSSWEASRAMCLRAGTLVQDVSSFDHVLEEPHFVADCVQSDFQVDSFKAQK